MHQLEQGLPELVKILVKIVVFDLIVPAESNKFP